MGATAMKHSEPANSNAKAKVVRPSQDRYHRNLKVTRGNFVPPQSWLQYNFIDKDPELDFAAMVIERSGMNPVEIEELTEKQGHKISRYTIWGWLYGGTKRPHNATMSHVMACLGWERHWTQRGKH